MGVSEVVEAEDGHVLNAEMAIERWATCEYPALGTLSAARELGALSLSGALALVLLYARAGEDRFERAARRWIRRVQVHHSLRHREVELLRGAMGALRSRFDQIALTVLMETCQALRLPLPTMPP